MPPNILVQHILLLGILYLVLCCGQCVNAVASAHTPFILAHRGASLNFPENTMLVCVAVQCIGSGAVTDWHMVNAGVSACVDRRSEWYIGGCSPHKRRYVVLLTKLRLSTCTCSHGGFLYYPDQLVAFHDALLDRVTNCSGLVSSTTFDDLQQRCIVSEPDRFGSTYQASAIRIPLLREGVYSYLASSTVTLD